MQGWHWFIAADVERTNDHRAATHVVEHLPVDAELLVFRWQCLAAGDQELGPKQADTLGALLERWRHVRWVADVGPQVEPETVRRRGWLAAQPGETGALCRLSLDLILKLGQACPLWA